MFCSQATLAEKYTENPRKSFLKQITLKSSTLVPHRKYMQSLLSLEVSNRVIRSESKLGRWFSSQRCLDYLMLVYSFKMDQKGLFSQKLYQKIKTCVVRFFPLANKHKPKLHCIQCIGLIGLFYLNFLTGVCFTESLHFCACQLDIHAINPHDSRTILDSIWNMPNTTNDDQFRP